MAVRTRFAPKPHRLPPRRGGAHRALLLGSTPAATVGRFILRIEDTDRERSTQGAVEGILDGLTWLGLDWDEGPCYQSERMERYREAVESLLASGSAYRCYCSKERLDSAPGRAARTGARSRAMTDTAGDRDEDRAPPGAKPPVIRFRTPHDGETVIDDLVRGRVVMRNDGAGRPRDRPGGRHAHLQLLGGGGRPRHGGDPRHPGRRSRDKHPSAKSTSCGRSGARFPPTPTFR